MRGADAAAVAEAAFSTVGVKSFSRAERVERVEMGMYFRRAGARGSRINANSENQGN